MSFGLREYSACSRANNMADRAWRSRGDRAGEQADEGAGVRGRDAPVSHTDGEGLIEGDERTHDYVVVLDRRLGETTGWMGARGYVDAWNNRVVWQHIGYPGDLASGQVRTWQEGILSNGNNAAAQEILHQFDASPGHSGGPFLGFRYGDPGPRVVAVHSWSGEINNGASGSGAIRDLVVLARSEFA